MSKTSDSLYDLIQSLTKSEKRYFKLLSSRHTIGEENNYVLLFDYLEKASYFDEEELRKHFKGEAFLNKFSITKKRLYDRILNALNQFHLINDIEAKAYGLLHSAEILFQKSLYSQSRKTLVSAEKLAAKHQLTNVLLEIRKKQKKILEKNNYLDVDFKAIEVIQKEDREILLQTGLENELWTQKSKLFRQLMQRGPARNETDQNAFDDIVSTISKISRPETSTFEALYLENHVMAAYYFALNDWENSFAELKKNWNLFQENGHQIEAHPDRYLSILSNLIYTSDKIGRQDELEMYMNELRLSQKEIEKDGEFDLKSKYFSTLSSLELTLATKNGHFTEIQSKLAEIECGIEEYDKQLTDIRKAFLYFKMAEINLVCGEAKAALENIRQVIGNTKLDKKEDILTFSHLLEILIHIELENFDTLPYLVKSTRRFLKTRNRMYELEKEILSTTLKFTAGQSSFEKEDIWNAFLSKIEANSLKKDLNRAQNYFNFKSWALSKITQTSYADLIKQGQSPKEVA
jgi:hypothetical protein